MRTQRAKSRSRKGRAPKQGRKAKFNFNLGWNSGPPAKGRTRGKEVMAVTAPSAIGFQLPASTFNIIGRPLATADYDTTRGIRISGSGLANFTITNVARNLAGLLDTAVPTAVASQFYIPVVPGNVDPRLYQIAKTFQFYAFRTLEFVYVPAVGTNVVNNVAWGISQDAEEFLQIPTPSQQQVLEFNYAATTPAWQTSTLRYEHPGTKTWTTNYLGDEPGPVSQFYQAQISAVFSAPYTPTGPTAPTTLTTGTVFVKYVIDLYEPQPVEDVLAGHAVNPDNGYIGASPDHCRMSRLEEELRELLLRVPCLESKEDFPDLPTPLVRSESVLLSPILL